MCRASGMSSKPTTAISSGTFLPADAKRFKRADRHIVVGGEDGVELGTFREQLADRGLAGFRLEVFRR